MSVPPTRHTPAGELAAWTHMWMVAATQTLGHLEDSWDDDEPLSSIGARDALCLVVIDAVRNVYRGARAALPHDAEALARFEEALPQLVRIRDFFEHFDEYVAGRGRVQRDADTLPDHRVGMELRRSASDGAGGHSMTFAVREGEEHAKYEVSPRAAVRAAQRLARDVLEHTGLLDERHLAACQACARSILSERA